MRLRERGFDEEEEEEEEAIGGEEGRQEGERLEEREGP